MKIILFFLLIASFLACVNSNENAKKTSAVAPFASINKGIDSVDYCTACDSLDIWQGGIQGIKVSDSTGIFLFGECHTNKAYDLICVPKDDILKFKSSISSDSLTKYYNNGKGLKYKNLDCYAFVIKKMEHKKKANQDKDCDCEDLDTYDYVFPDSVKVFKRTDEGWLLIKTKKITSFEQLGRLKLNVVFNVD